MMALIRKRYPQVNTPSGRRKAGIIVSITGVLLNLTLFLLKYAGGRLSGSVAITTDGFNNLADTCSCLLALFGIIVGSKPPDRRYPMGYGRLEYLSGALISGAILLIGVKTLLASFDKILHPKPIEGGSAVIIILLISITVKGSMFRFYSRIGRLIRSSGMKAAAVDSLSDCCATFAILAAILIERLTGCNADGYTGVAVAVCILYAGSSSFKESLSPLLGRGIDADTLEQLYEVIGEFPDIRRVRQILLHDYGAHQKLLTLEIDAENGIDTITELTNAIRERLGVSVVIAPCHEKIGQRSIKPRLSAHNSDRTNPTQMQEREASEHQTR